MNQAERNYATIEKEALAIVFAAKQFHHYINGHEVVVVTDHAPLVYLSKMRDVNQRLTRWLLSLQHLNLSIEYRPGRMNMNADCLSRIPTGDINSIISHNIDPLLETPLDLTVEQRKDKFCGAIINYLEDKELNVESKPFWMDKIEQFFTDSF